MMRASSFSSTCRNFSAASSLSWVAVSCPTSSSFSPVASFRLCFLVADLGLFEATLFGLFGPFGPTGGVLPLLAPVPLPTGLSRSFFFLLSRCFNMLTARNFFRPSLPRAVRCIVTAAQYTNSPARFCAEWRGWIEKVCEWVGQ